MYLILYSDNKTETVLSFETKEVIGNTLRLLKYMMVWQWFHQNISLHFFFITSMFFSSSIVWKKQKQNIVYILNEISYLYEYWAENILNQNLFRN